ncbi:hypothetical protein [Peredibacter starrii]|uniref:Uncharacterized protein n=1 Tax=Peredibacter starrii TaxID=28202 RepID=A0AAX4HNS7_9BACT|nr:hypothetical protein [Peredibacter starrii]WPU64816.1 hypothetical protein SOO65_19155 [Peredibacter starrii]
MKFFIVLALVASSAVYAAPTATKRAAPVQKEMEAAKKETAKSQKKEEDCDDKAKKPIEIKEETISLSGNTGCSLDDAH